MSDIDYSNDNPVKSDAISAQIAERFGVVTKQVEPGKVWRVKFRGSWWNARTPEGLENTILDPGARVHVIGRSGVTLVVLPLDADLLQWDLNIREDRKVENRKNEEQDSQKSQQHVESQNPVASSQRIIEKGDRTIAFTAGGAFLGGMIAQVPGAIAGAFAGAIFGLFSRVKAAQSSGNS